MPRTLLVVLLVLGIAMPHPPVAAQVGSTTDPDLAAGIRQVREGDFDAALVTLDGVVKRLSQEKGHARELARAYTYLAIAYIGLSQEQTAKAKFLEAWKSDNDMSLSPKEFPPSVIEFFEKTKKEAEATPKPSPPPARVAAPAPPAPAAPTPAASPAVASEKTSKGGGGGKGILIGLGAAALGGIALAAGGGGGSSSSSSSPSTPTTPPTPAPTPRPSPPSLPTTFSPAVKTGEGKVTFLGSQPGPGSNLVVSNGSATLRMSLLIQSPGHHEHTDIIITMSNEAGDQCVRVGGAGSITLDSNQPAQFDIGNFKTSCNTPFFTTLMSVAVQDQDAGETLVKQSFAGGYAFGY